MLRHHLTSMLRGCDNIEVLVVLVSKHKSYGIVIVVGVDKDSAGEADVAEHVICHGQASPAVQVLVDFLAPISEHPPGNEYIRERVNKNELSPLSNCCIILPLSALTLMIDY